MEFQTWRTFLKSAEIEDPTMFTGRSVPRLEDLAFEKAAASILGDLVLCDMLLYKTTTCYHRHSSILSMLGLNDSDCILKYVKSRVEELPGVVGEKFRERFLEKILKENPDSLRQSVLYDLVLFEALSELKFKAPTSSAELKDFCDILVKKSPKLQSVNVELPRWSSPLENTSLLFKSFSKLKDLQTLVISTDLGLEKPEYYRILGFGCKKVKNLRFEKVILNNDCLASLLLTNPMKIYFQTPGRKKELNKSLHVMMARPNHLTPVGQNVENLYFEYNMPDGIDAKLMAHVLFNMPKLQTIYIDPTHVGEIFRLMKWALRKLPPVKLTKIRVEGEDLEVLKNINLVAPNIEAMELVEMSDIKKIKGIPIFQHLQTLSIFGADKNVQKVIFPKLCPQLEILSCAFIPSDLRDIHGLTALKKLEIEPYNGRSVEQDVPLDFFKRIESFKSTTGCLGASFGREIVNRPGSLKELDIQCIHDISSDEDFQQFVRHGKWEIFKIRRCESLTLERVLELLRLNPGLKEILLPKSVVPEIPMQEMDAKMVMEITRYCSEKQVSLKIDPHGGYRCFFEPYSSVSDIDMRHLFTSFVLDTGSGLYVDSDDEDDDPNFFDMLQRAMVGDYDIDDIYGEYGDMYDSDFSY